MPPTHLTEEDEGKRVVTSDGTELGKITEVRDGTPYIDADPTVMETLKLEFDWDVPDEDDYPLETADVAEVTDETVHLQ